MGIPDIFDSICIDIFTSQESQKRSKETPVQWVRHPGDQTVDPQKIAILVSIYLHCSWIIQGLFGITFL